MIANSFTQELKALEFKYADFNWMTIDPDGLVKLFESRPVFAHHWKSPIKQKSLVCYQLEYSKELREKILKSPMDYIWKTKDFSPEFLKSKLQ